MTNPYESPRNASWSPMRVPSPWNPKTQGAMIVFSILFGMGYQLTQNFCLGPNGVVPIWPHLTIPTLVSVVAAIGSRNLIAPPLASLAGIVAGLMVFAAFRGLPACELQISLPVAVFCSLPSFCIALLSRTRFGTQEGSKSSKTAELKG
jgi:hypothetical protein